MSASGSLFTATITLLDVIPAGCWMAPEIPSATYRSGVTVSPVCPTCSSFGRQPASVTAREAPTAPPSASASCSTRCQFSGPLRPRPPDTTTRASASETRLPLDAVGANLVNASFSALVSAGGAGPAGGGAVPPGGEGPGPGGSTPGQATRRPP